MGCGFKTCCRSGKSQLFSELKISIWHHNLTILGTHVCHAIERWSNIHIYNHTRSPVKYEAIGLIEVNTTAVRGEYVGKIERKIKVVKKFPGSLGQGGYNFKIYIIF